jgi:hypothetical protein
VGKLWKTLWKSCETRVTILCKPVEISQALKRLQMTVDFPSTTPLLQTQAGNRVLFSCVDPYRNFDLRRAVTFPFKPLIGSLADEYSSL